MWWHTNRNQISSFGDTDESFKSAGASVQSTTGSRGVRISCSNAGCTMSRGSAKSTTGYPLYSPVSLSFPLPALPCAITFQLESSCGRGLVLLPSLRWRATWQLIWCGDETFVDCSTANVLSLPLTSCRHLRLHCFSTRGASGQGRVVQCCVQTAQQSEMHGQRDLRCPCQSYLWSAIPLWQPATLSALVPRSSSSSSSSWQPILRLVTKWRSTSSVQD